MGLGLIGGDTNSTGDVVNQVNQNIAQLKANEVTTIFKDDTGTRRVLLGRGNDGFYGVKVSQAGSDVYTAGNDKLVFNSDNNSFKILGSGTISVISQNTASDGTYGFSNAVVGSVEHDLGFRPIVLGFTEENLTGLVAGASTSLPLTITNNPTLAAGSNFVIWTLSLQADETKVYAISQLATYGANTSTITTPATTVKYYLLQETAN